MFKLERANFLNYTFKCLDHFILKDNNNLANYITKFNTFVNKISICLSKFKIDDNFFYL